VNVVFILNKVIDSVVRSFAKHIEWMTVYQGGSTLHVLTHSCFTFCSFYKPWYYCSGVFIV